MSSSRPEVHFQVASAVAPPQMQQIANALGLPDNASFEQIVQEAKRMTAAQSALQLANQDPQTVLTLLR